MLIEHALLRICIYIYIYPPAPLGATRLGSLLLQFVVLQSVQLWQVAICSMAVCAILASW